MIKTKIDVLRRKNTEKVSTMSRTTITKILIKVFEDKMQKARGVPGCSVG